MAEWLRVETSWFELMYYLCLHSHEQLQRSGADDNIAIHAMCLQKNHRDGLHNDRYFKVHSINFDAIFAMSKQTKQEVGSKFSL